MAASHARDGTSTAQRVGGRTLSLSGLAEEVMKLAKHEANGKKPFSRALTSSDRDDIIERITAASRHFSLAGVQLATEVLAVGSRDLTNQANKIVRSIEKCFSTLYKSCCMIVQKPSQPTHRTSAISSMMEALVWIKELANLALLMDKVKIEKQLGKVQRQVAKLVRHHSHQQVQQLQRLHRKAVELYRQFMLATQKLTAAGRLDSAAASIHRSVLEWSEQLVHIIVSASKSDVFDWSQSETVRSSPGMLGIYAREPLLNQISASVDKLIVLLEEDGDSGTAAQKAQRKKARAPSGLLSNALASFEFLAAKEPPNANRSALESHITALRHRCNVILQHSGSCIDIRNHDNMPHHGSLDGNEMMTSRQTKAEIAIETVTLANNTLLSAISDLPSNKTPRDLATLRRFDDSLNRFLPAVASLRRRLFRVCAEHYVTVVAQFDPALFEERPVESSSASVHSLVPASTSPGVAGTGSRRVTSPLSPIESVSSVSLDLPTPSPTLCSTTPSPSSPLRPFCPVFSSPCALAVEDVLRDIDCVLESDFLKCKARLLEQHHHILQMCQSVSLLAMTQHQRDLAELLHGKLKCLTDVLVACCDRRRASTQEKMQAGVEPVMQICVQSLTSLYKEACTGLAKDIPLMDITSTLDLHISDSMEASRTFSLLGSTDALGKSLSSSYNLASSLLDMLKTRVRDIEQERTKRIAPRRSPIRSTPDGQLAEIVHRLETTVLRDMRRLRALASSRTPHLVDDVNSLTREVVEFLNDLHLSSHQLKTQGSWNAVDTDDSDEEKEQVQDDYIASGVLQTIPESSQDTDGGTSHNRLANLSTIAEESEISDDDNDFGLKRSQSLSRRSSLRASCRLLSFSSASSLSEENELVTGIFQDWAWAKSHIQTVASELFHAIEHALSLFTKSRRRGSGSDVSKLIKLCQIQWEDMNEQCLVRLKEVLGDSLPQKLVALYANTSLLCHQITSIAEKENVAASSQLEENKTKVLQQYFQDLQQSVVDTLTATRRYTVIKKSRSRSRPIAPATGSDHSQGGHHNAGETRPGLVFNQHGQGEYFI